jgi:hypothetical protein
MASGTSYNGWPANSDKNAIGVEVFGDPQGFPFPGGVKAGDVATVLGYVATQLHTRVEPCVSGWCWGYTYKQNVNNPSSLSCHASGTAIDWNAPDHSNGSSGTFTDDQVGTIYRILDEVQGAVDWLEGYDEMHFEIAVSASTLANIAATLPAGGGSGDWFDQVTEDEMRSLLDGMLSPIKADVAECKARLRGSDTGAGERHEVVDMLQGIDGAVADTFARVRGTDPNVDSLQRLGMDHADILSKLG